MGLWVPLSWWDCGVLALLILTLFATLLTMTRKAREHEQRKLDWEARTRKRLFEDHQ